MARSYAQLAAVVFALVGLGGFLTGDAGNVFHGQANGNFDGVALHLTYTRDVINVLLAAAFAYAGFVGNDTESMRTVLAAGGFLLLLAVVGFIVGDTDSGARSIASLHFPVAINIFDLITGALAIVCALGSLGEEAPATG